MRQLLLAPALLGLLACGRSGLLDEGDTAPNVTLQRLDGAGYPLNSLHGKTVLLNFWFRH